MMDARQKQDLGEAIQNHIRRKWNFKEHWSSEVQVSLEIDEELKERIYLLGVDDRLLLDIHPSAVVDRLEELERAAVMEDSGFRDR